MPRSTLRSLLPSVCALPLLGVVGCSGSDVAPGGSGGMLGTGGDAATSGQNASGGGASTGGTGGDSGSGGTATGGTANTGGSQGNAPASPGCGATTHPSRGDYRIEVRGKTREYTLDVPAGYGPDTPYPLTFGIHWRYGNSGDVVSNDYYGLKSRSNGGMIFVSPEGLTPNGVSGWANDQDEDVEFVSLVLDRMEEELCIDRAHVFATGFSFGGMFSNAIGCALADRFRAIAPYSGSLWSGCAAGSTPIAFLGTHGTTDNVVGIDAGRDARDEFLSRNGCSTTSTPVGTNGCVRYDGCDAENPVVWCEYSGGHSTPNFATDEVWSFFSSL